MTTPTDTPSPRGPLVRTAVLVVLAAAAAGLWWAFDRTPPDPAPPAAADSPPDPRLTFPTAFRNVKPGVAYVGDAACAGCHPGIDATYHAHPMGRSAARVADSHDLEKYGPDANNPFTTGGFTLAVERTPGGIVHAVTATDPACKDLPAYRCPADLAVGSGTRGRSYLTVRGGFVWQTPISWFGPDARWDVSPGFSLPDEVRRAVVGECLFCHVDHVEPVPGASNRFRGSVPTGQPNVGCERCHGPGALHAAERADVAAPAGVDTSIVNPRHLPPDLRRSVCQQCHLQGAERVARRGRSVFEFRPGLPLELFQTVFVPAAGADLRRSVGQFEQMAASKCMTGSGGALDCTSCHDPHRKPAVAEADAFYRGRCLTCHETRGCSAPAVDRRAKADSCVTCHVPKAASSTIAHAAVTDHRVPRRPGSPPRPVGRRDPAAPPLVPFAAGAHAPPAAELDRDLGIVLARVVGQMPAGRPERAAFGWHADRRLTAAVAAWPGDADARLGLVTLRTARGDAAGALVAARAALRAAPDSDAAWGYLADALADAGELGEAARTADELVRRNPQSADYRMVRASVHARRADWPAAEADARAAAAIVPILPRAHLMLAVARARQGDAAGGRRALAAAVGLAPDPRAKRRLEELYAEQTR